MFVYVFNILLLSFLVAMFINRYKYVWQNIDAIRRMEIIKLKNSNSFDNLYGGVTITFFPISVIVLPFVIPVVVFKSERLNDFILKIQYALMILMYCLIAVVVAVPLLPLLYVKSIMNAIYILLNNKREAYKGQNLVGLIITVLINPIILVISLFIDLITLPSMLLADERNFEFKYQQSLEFLEPAQTDVVLTTFAKIFYVNFEQQFGGKGMTLIELMHMHRKIFSLIDNLHDLMCRGNKDHKEALAQVQDYNMTKVLSRKCSIPDHTGDIKLARCDFNVLYNIQMDLELYNYIDVLMNDYKTGKLHNSDQGKRRLTREEQEEEEKGNGLNAGVSFLPMTAQPAGFTFKRDNADFMNNFFVDIVCRSFTNIEEIHRQNRENNEQNKKAAVLKELGRLKEHWN